MASDRPDPGEFFDLAQRMLRELFGNPGREDDEPGGGDAASARALRGPEGQPRAQRREAAREPHVRARHARRRGSRGSGARRGGDPSAPRAHGPAGLRARPDNETKARTEPTPPASDRASSDRLRLGSGAPRCCQAARVTAATTTAPRSATRRAPRAGRPPTTTPPRRSRRAPGRPAPPCCRSARRSSMVCAAMMRHAVTGSV